MTLMVNDAMAAGNIGHAGEFLDRRQCLERDVACLQEKLSCLPETFQQSLLPMTRLYQEILQQRLAALHELD